MQAVPQAAPVRRQRHTPVAVAAGVAAPYHDPVWQVGRCESLAPGAFKESLRDVVVARIGHGEAAPVIGTTADGTLMLFDGPRALRFQLDLTGAAARHHSVAALLAAGCFVGASVGYYVERLLRVGATNTYTVLKAVLFELTLVHHSRAPKHRGTDVLGALACTNCRAHHIEGYVHRGADRVWRCRSCGMRYDA
jgi:phage head maturation protease